eukprot:6205734-Pleurochrysis_carterae.AAC.1
MSQQPCSRIIVAKSIKKWGYRKLRNGAVLEAITNVRESLGTVIFMWIPSHVGIVPNIIADSIASRGHEEPPDRMITGLLGKQVKSRPVICGRKVQGRVEMADGPIYWEARQRGEKLIRGKVAKGSTRLEGVEEDTTWDMELAAIVGRNEMEKFVHGIRNGEVIGGLANARRMKHATREGNKPSFWTYLKVNGCRGCQKQEEEQTIHHVLSGGCEGLSKKENSRYREEMRVLLQKSKNLMRDKHNNAGVIQAGEALRALEQPRRQATRYARKNDEQALRQILSGIIPEWQEASDKGKRGTIEIMKLWTG